MMRFARTITAFAVALSLAMLPAAGATTAVAKPAATSVSDHGATSSEMSAAMPDRTAAMDDCCPDHAKPCDQGSDQCPSMASCAQASISMADAAVSAFSYSLVPEELVPLLIDQGTPLHGSSPPERPPRV